MPLPDFTFPRPLAALARRLPEWPVAQMFVTALNLAERAGKLTGDWSSLDGRTVRIEIEDLGAGLSFTRGGNRFVAVSGEPTVCFRARAADYLRIALREEDPDTLFFQRRLKIEGNTELGLELKNRLDALPLPDFLIRLRDRIA
ncbi:MAG: SCP2 sterol-binding domain-containing protein [Betaproteobacteria bacterium]|nr:SCP2 sterol-binding domain-containing protein [Betaproteobacteria bacterium]